MTTALTNGQRWQAQGVVSDKVSNSIRKCKVGMKLKIFNVTLYENDILWTLGSKLYTQPPTTLMPMSLGTQ